MNNVKSFNREFFTNKVNSSETAFFDNSRWLKTEEAAEYLSTSPAQIRNWVHQGKLKAHKLLGYRLRFRIADLDLLLKGGHKWE